MRAGDRNATLGIIPVSIESEIRNANYLVSYVACLQTVPAYVVAVGRVAPV